MPVTAGFAEVPDAERYVLRDVRVPVCLVDGADSPPADREGLADVSLGIEAGRIRFVLPGSLAADDPTAGWPSVSLRRGIALPCFVDMHTHLDKGHIWPRSPNPDGTFDGALGAAGGDRERRWSEDDVARRMDFALRSAFAHGTCAIRTHLDSFPPQDAISWPVLAAAKAHWAGRLELQGACLVDVECARDEAFMACLADRLVAHDGVLGAVTYMTPDLDELLGRLFAIADSRGLELDFHVDETGDPGARSLRHIAQVALERPLAQRVVVGHCCSLAVQDRDEVAETLDLVARAGLAAVSLPMCNLYLQDRGAGRTPRWRGLTLVHEMRARGIEVAFASDNVRDPFYAYGDLDMLEVFREATRIAHLDHPIDEWIRTVTRAPGEIIGLPATGRIAVAGPADLVLCRGRSYTELLARPEAQRTVLRAGRPIDRTLPDFAELDDLMGPR